MAKESQFDKTLNVDAFSGGVEPPRDLSGKRLGDFQVERLLGHGGMGEVYLARQVSLDRPVALKVLRPEWASNPAYMARFEAEALAAAKLNHPNIVTIYSVGAVEDIRFIAMEYVQGTNLREYIVKKGVPDLPLALAVMRQSGLAVGAAGEAGLAHRDIKPENLLLTRKGQVKVADFGLAQLPEADRLHITQPGATLGTPMYMSPEQVTGGAVDHRSDLYSLGVTFYHMLTGRAPFHADTAVALALKHLREKPVSLAERRPDLPPALCSLVMKLMEKEPANRYSSAGDMLRDLAKIKESIQAGNAATPAGQEDLETLSEDEEESEDRGWKPSGRALVLAGIPGLILGAVLGWLGRAPNLLADEKPAPNLLPGSWMVDTSGVPKMPAAISQYRYAQTRSTPLDREASWLAVPSRFPKDSDTALAAYIQLTRMYLRRGDAERLEALSQSIQEIEKSRDGKREKWLSVGRVAHAAAAAVKGDVKEVSSTYGNGMGDLKLMDPSLAELSVEVTDRATESSGGKTEQLRNVRAQLFTALRLTPALLEFLPPSPRG